MPILNHLRMQEATPPPTPMEEEPAEEAADAAEGRPADAACAHCKPLAPAPQVRSAQGKTPLTGRVICGHDAFYIFLRLHHHLYERCACPARPARLAVCRWGRLWIVSYWLGLDFNLVAVPTKATNFMLLSAPHRHSLILDLGFSEASAATTAWQTSLAACLCQDSDLHTPALS